ncbi:MAG: hypothetical protein R3B47_05280 [Bacteroidia bacterium]
MFSGESSFLDWREQTYPKWMDNKDIYASFNLGTNVVHYQAHRILAEMAKLKGEPHEVWEQRAEGIKGDHIFDAGKGYAWRSIPLWPFGVDPVAALRVRARPWPSCLAWPMMKNRPPPSLRNRR